MRFTTLLSPTRRQRRRPPKAVLYRAETSEVILSSADANSKATLLVLIRRLTNGKAGASRRVRHAQVNASRRDIGVQRPNAGARWRRRLVLSFSGSFSNQAPEQREGWSFARHAASVRTRVKRDIGVQRPNAGFSVL